MSYFRRRPQRGARAMHGLGDTPSMLTCTMYPNTSGCYSSGTTNAQTLAEQQRQEQARIAAAGGGTAATTPPPDPTKPSGSSWGSDLAKIFGALAVNKIASTSQPVGPYVVPQQQGISTTTLLIGGALGVTALVLLLK